MYGSNIRDVGERNATDGICAHGENGPFMFQYTNGNPGFRMPDDIGFPVGEGVEVKFLLLMIHFHESDPSHVTTSGDAGVVVRLIGDADHHLKPAGVMMLNAKRNYPPGVTTFAEVACRVQSPIEMHPFAFHVHGHSLQIDISGWMMDPRNGSWKLIGRLNPQLPISYHPVHDENMVIKQGDLIASRCVVINTRDHVVMTG